MTLLSLCCSGPRPELHAVAAHRRADPAQTQSTAPGPAALRQAHGVAEEHPQGEIRGALPGRWRWQQNPRGFSAETRRQMTLVFSSSSSDLCRLHEQVV